MALSLTIDMIDNADLSVDYPTTGGEIVKATRTARVKGITYGEADDAKTAMDRAVNYLLSQYPRFSIYTPRFSQARLMSVRATGIDKDDDAVIIRMVYDTPPLKAPEGGIIPWTVEDNTSIVQNTTQIDPKTWAPLSVSFYVGGSDTHPITDIVTISYPSTVRTIVLSGYVLDADLKRLRKAVNTVNEGKFLDLDQGFWRFAQFRDQFPILIDPKRVIDPIYFLSIELQTQIDRSWAVFAILRDPHTRKYVPVEDKVMTGLKDAKYDYGIIRPIPNGAILVGPHAMTNFGQLFGPIPIT